jgi:integrase
MSQRDLRLFFKIILDKIFNLWYSIYMIKINEQAQRFMDHIQTRRRDPAKVKTIAAYRSYLDNWVLPYLGKMNVKDVENGTLKAFIAQISPKLAATTVTAVVSLVKSIVSSAVDENGNELYPRKWNNEFIDLPLIKKTNLDAPVIGGEAVFQAISRAFAIDRALYSLLAGSGLRIGEALALRSSDWDKQNAIINVNSTLLPDGTIQESPKTESGVRQVDINQQLNQYLINNLSNDGTGRIFPVTMRTAYNRLFKDGLDTGFHAFRRFRRTHLEIQNVPGGFVRYWMGHADRDVDDSYVKVSNDLVARKQWAERAGLGFELPQ